MQNRIIKFRGKPTSTDLDGSDFIYGDIRRIGKKMYICQDIPRINAINVDPETVGQYTGLKDKNGKDIFEGDTVNIGEPGCSEPCEVVFSEGCFGIKASWTDAVIELNNYCNNVFEQCVEIIGNIHSPIDPQPDV